MDRTFRYRFYPAESDPVEGTSVTLSDTDIEAADIKEVLQTPGASLGSWDILDRLLQPTGSGSLFVFREPLGQEREVKIALSGLFGRFVARAYLERYFDLGVFVHLGQQSVTLGQGQQFEIRRVQGGDLPDWVVCKPNFTELTVAKTK